ncbi:MAG: hypothetical protein FJ000_06735 [Actinobacteria bacterium]|nr:hypothetical protein [Actinomycetota bacterium]
MSTAFARPSPPAQCRLALFGGLLLILAAMTVATLATAEQAAAVRALKISVNRPDSVLSGTRVVARVRAFDQSGKAIKGVRVRFRWTYDGVTRTAVSFTGPRGRTSNGRRFDCGSSFFKVTLKVRATWKDQVRRVTRSFWVSGGT